MDTTLRNTGSEIVTVAAPAKVNLYLHVVGRRADGYHLLDSLVAFTALGDTVSVRRAAGLGLTVDGPFAGAPALVGENIVLRAAQALADRLGRDADVAIRLTKRLPVAAGIGGGSADAAATLVALCRLWNVGDDAVDLPAIGQVLGADVPVCLVGRPTLMAGIGEDLRPAPALPPAALVLVNPGLPLSTPAVFQARAGAFSAPGRFGLGPPLAGGELVARLAACGNDLAAPARRLCPAIGEVLATLAPLPGCRLARMSGSGPTCFGLFDDLAAAVAAARRVERRDWWVAPTILLGAAAV